MTSTSSNQNPSSIFTTAINNNNDNSSLNNHHSWSGWPSTTTINDHYGQQHLTNLNYTASPLSMDSIYHPNK